MILPLAYIGLTLLMIAIICIIGFRAITETVPDQTTAHRKKWMLVGGLALWQLYIFLMASSGLLNNFDFPPRFFLFLILPAFLFTGFFIYSHRRSAWINAIPKSWLVYYQTFRILIESLFVFTVAVGILHPNVTIEGYNYDMVFAFTAPLVAYLVFNRKMLSEKVAMWWNFLGLLVISFIIFLFLSSIYLPNLYGEDSMMMPMEFASYPYVLVAGFLMPSAVFMHVLSIVQLTRKRKPV